MARRETVSVRRGDTRERILDSATTLFGTRGFEAVSLDQIAADVGVAKQTVLYWFTSKEELVHRVLVRTVEELTVVVEAAIRATLDDPLQRLEAVIHAVFRSAVRRPALLGLLREMNRLPAHSAQLLSTQLQPLVDRATAWMRIEMDAGRMRPGNPEIVVALVYATVTGIATEPEALRVAGWTEDVVGLRRLRSEMTAFLTSALAPMR
jgi:TetR/AcrR family transcriptional regulator